METEECYNKCKACLVAIQDLFKHYCKYSNCVSVSYFDNEINGISHKVANGYTLLMLKVNRTILNNLMIIADDDAPMIDTEAGAVIEQVIELMELYKDGIIAMLNDTSLAKRAAYVSGFEAELNDARCLINRMETMISNSQMIHHSYLRATA
jgi:hypothetical protein